MRPGGARLARALLAVAALAGCEPYVQGNGIYVEEQRDLPPFTGVHVEDGIEAFVTAGAESQSVVVNGDANLVQYVKTQVRDEVVRGATTKVLHLTVDLKEFDETIPVRVVVKTAEVAYAFATEESEVTIGAAAAADMVVNARGHSLLRLGGAGGTTLHATLDDASLQAQSYPVEFAEVSLANGSWILLNASGAVSGTADASSTVDNLRGDGTCAGVNGGGAVCCKPDETCSR